MWDSLLSEREITSIAKCSRNLFGNILSSDTDDVEVVNVGEERRPLASLCQKSDEFVIVPEKWYIGPTKKFCSVSNSEVFTPADDIVNEQLFNETRKFLEQCSGKSYRLLRLGATDSVSDGDWRRFKDGAPLSYTAWAPGEPNDGPKSDCIVLKKSLSKWGDVDCKDEYCFSCLKDKERFLQIRGLCQQKEHHTRFLLDGYVNARPFFRGYYGHSMFMTEGGDWVLHDGLANKTLAVMNKRRSLTTEYPLGRRQWKVLSPFCKNFVDDVVEISLSACATDEFTCADGSCVPGSVRCNLLEDCLDSSDEENCNLVEFPEGYHGHRPPPGVTFQDPLLVQPTVNIIRFSNVDDINLAVYLEFEISLAWTDRNLKFRNLKINAENKLSSEEARKVWIPEMEFLNVNDGRLKVLKKSLFVRAVGEPDPPHFNDVKMGKSPLGLSSPFHLTNKPSVSCHSINKYVQFIISIPMICDCLFRSVSYVLINIQAKYPNINIPFLPPQTRCSRPVAACWYSGFCTRPASPVTSSCSIIPSTHRPVVCFLNSHRPPHSSLLFRYFHSSCYVFLIIT